MVSHSTNQGGSTKDNGFKIRDTAQGMNCSLIEIFIMVLTSQANHTVKVCILGSMARFMMASGCKESSTATAFGEVQEATRILGSGSMAKRRGMVCMSGSIRISMRASGSGI